MEEGVEVSLDDQGRMVIPPTLQHRLGLQPGTTLVVEQGDAGQIYLRPQTTESMLVDKQGVTVVRTQPLGDLSHVTRFERDRRVSDLVERTQL